jgi:hypothetical protein
MKKIKARSSGKAARPALQPGDCVDVSASAATIQSEALNLFRAMRAGTISKKDADLRHQEIRKASKVLDDVLRQERAVLRAAKDFIRLRKR